MKVKKIGILFFFLCIGSLTVFSQSVGISETIITPDPSSLLELQSTQRGFLLPRMTVTQRDAIASPAEALMIFNTTTKCLEIYVMGWHPIWCDTTCNPPDMPLAITGDTVVCPGEILTYCIPAVTGATDYTWSIPAGWLINSGQGTTCINVTAGTIGQNGSITVVANNSCGSSSPQTLNVQVSDNGGVIGIRVGTGFYGNSVGDYSTITITFDQPYTNVTYVSSCSGSCTCSGTGTTFHHETSGGMCLGASLIVRDFEFAVMPTSVTITMVGKGVHSYHPNFWYILPGGVISSSAVDSCNNSAPYLYTTWNETSNCTFLNLCP